MDERSSDAMSRGDGRNVDERIGVLEGEAAEQAIAHQRTNQDAVPFHVWDRVASSPMEGSPTYFDRPAIKEPVWIWAVPAYFYVGGTAGAAAVLAGVAQMADRRALRGLVAGARRLAAAGCGIGTLLLIYDLGRPGRFLNMLRVFRPTSAMNMGSWILAGATGLSTASAALAQSRGATGKLGDVAGLGAAVLGLPLTGYTAVLLADTSVPIWKATHKSLPALFVASAAGGAANLLLMTDLDAREARVVQRFGVLAKGAELVARIAVERDARRVERVARPLKDGLGGILWSAAKVLTATSLGISLLPRKRRAKRLLAGSLGTLGSVAVKFAVFHAGKMSARDPRATFEQQRAT